jgi:hypothetical protein
MATQIDAIAQSDQTFLGWLKSKLFSWVTGFFAILSLLTLADDLRIWHAIFVRLFELIEVGSPQLIWAFEILHTIVESWRSSLEWLFGLLRIDLPEVFRSLLSLLSLVGLRGLPYAYVWGTPVTPIQAYFRRLYSLSSKSVRDAYELVTLRNKYWRYRWGALVFVFCIGAAAYLAWVGRFDDAKTSILIILAIPFLEVLVLAFDSNVSSFSKSTVEQDTSFDTSVQKIFKQQRFGTTVVRVFVAAAAILYIIDYFYVTCCM